MKKSLLYFLVFFAPVIARSADDDQNFSGQVKIGFNISQIDGDNVSGFNKLGLKIGGGVSFELVDDFFLSGELEFSQKGSRSSDEEPYLRINLSYIQMPIHFRYEFLNQGFFEAGLYFGRLLSAKADDGFGFEDQTEFQSFEYGLSLGAGYVGFYPFVPMVHFERSLASINKSGNLLNRVVVFSIRYFL